MKTITLNDPTSGLRQVAADYAKTWVNTYIKDSPVFSDADLDVAEISLLAWFDFPVRHTEVHLPPSIDPEAAKYPECSLPDGVFRVMVFAADPDDNVELVIPLEALS